MNKLKTGQVVKKRLGGCLLKVDAVYSNGFFSGTVVDQGAYKNHPDVSPVGAYVPRLYQSNFTPVL